MRPNADDRTDSDAVVNARNRIAQIGGSLGTQNPEYASALNQLALLLIMQGDADTAEPFLREALEVRGATLGENHPDYATNLSSLGGVLWARGELEEAEPLLRKASEVRCATLGPGHPKSVVSINSLDQLQRALRDRRNAKPVAPAPLADQAPDIEPAPVEFPASVPAPAVAITPSPRIVEPAVAPVAAADRTFTDDLEKEVQAIRDDFATLADRLTNAARGLVREGVVAPETLATSCRESRRKFEDLRTSTLDALRELSLPVPPQAIMGLEEIAALLPSVRESETSRANWVVTRAKSLAVLERVQGLTCPSQPGFEPLSARLEEASALSVIVKSSVAGAPSDEITKLAAGSHPFSALLALVAAGDGTSDADWAELYESVETAFGNPLAVAAARSRLEEPSGRAGEGTAKK